MFKMWTLVLLALVVFISSCASVPTPSATESSKLTTPLTSTRGVAVAPQPPPDDEAWAKVIQEAKREGQVLIYSFSFAGDVGLVVSRAFREKFGIKAEIVAGTSPVMLERIRSEYRAKQFTTDVADMSPARILSLKDDKLSLSIKDLPALRDKAGWYTHPLDMDPEGYTLNYSPTVSTPYINTTLVKPGEEPQSWLDLLQPRWKGKVMVGDPGVYVGTTYIYYGLVRKSKRLNEDYFRQLGGQISKFVPGSARDQALVLVRGEGSINISVSTAGSASLLAEGAPIRAISLKEGWGSNPAVALAMLSNAPHPNAARLFLNWFLSAEGMKVFAQSASQITYRRDVPDFLPNAARVDPSTAINLDLKDLDESNTLYNAGYLTKLWKGETGK